MDGLPINVGGQNLSSNDPYQSLYQSNDRKSQVHSAFPQQHRAKYTSLAPANRNVTDDLMIAERSMEDEESSFIGK